MHTITLTSEQLAAAIIALSHELTETVVDADQLPGVIDAFLALQRGLRPERTDAELLAEYGIAAA